tara:strand:- start:151 stop:417 length:267 start_codon:yes stop_codon:yes gene_type:complete
MKLDEKTLKNLIKEEISSLKEGYHLDKEGKMAKNQLFKAQKYSLELLEMLPDEAQLPSWVQSKITLASDYLAKVKHYLEYEMISEEEK